MGVVKSLAQHNRRSKKMARKHNCKHERSPSKYKKRLADRGLGKTPRMKWTGLTTAQIEKEFASLPHYRWTLITKDEDGNKLSHPFQRRTMVL